jgi:hypothetical protein
MDFYGDLAYLAFRKGSWENCIMNAIKRKEFGTFSQLIF